MGRRTRRGAMTEGWQEKVKTAVAEGEKGPELELGDDQEDAGEPRDRSELEVLMEDFDLDRAGALFVLGYASTRPDEDPLKLAELLRAQPWVWAAVGATDYVRFSFALSICGLPSLESADLQEAVSKMHHELDDGRSGVRGALAG